MAKLRILFHASPDTHIKVFEPHKESVRDLDEGPVVFATTDKAVASMFLVPSSDDWVTISRFNKQPVIVVSDRKRFERNDRGGAIYELSADTFTTDPSNGMGDAEWISRTPVIPRRKQVYPSAVNAMLELGVQVYFVDKKTFLLVRQASDYGFNIISRLSSENQRLGINVRALGNPPT